MLDKKGDFGFPFYFFPAISLLVLTLVLFGVMFFVVEIGKSPNLVIKSESYQDSSKLITILTSPTKVQENNDNITIAELISLAKKDNNYQDELISEIKFLLDRLPRLQMGETLADVTIASPASTRETVKEGRWILEIKTNGNNLTIGETQTLASNYLSQSAFIPLSDGELAEVILYLNCFACKEEDIDFVA